MIEPKFKIGDTVHNDKLGIIDTIMGIKNDNYIVCDGKCTIPVSQQDEWELLGEPADEDPNYELGTSVGRKLGFADCKSQVLVLLNNLEAQNNCGTDEFIEAKRIAYSQIRDAVNSMQEE